MQFRSFRTCALVSADAIVSACSHRGNQLTYQSHSDGSGVSKSDEKLRSLRLPKSLAGKSVLDLGCNEGFFALEAKRRGAKRVVGVDRNEAVIAAARQRAAEANLEVEFICADMLDIPEEEFDFVLLLSALHYIDDPQALFERVSRALSPTGMLILECGVAGGHGKTLHRALRSIDDRMFPTFEMLRDVWLADYALRLASPSVNQVGDPIPRSVFYCHPIKPIVMLIRGGGGVGKSVLASKLSSAVTISTDALFSPQRSTGRMFYPEGQKLYDEEKVKFNGSNRLAWNHSKSDKRVRQLFLETTARAVKLARAPLIVVEGYVIDDLAPELIKLLGSEYRCWTVDSL
jgi:SAM-dependent methyltransferase